jgi:hypothetical protein
VEAVRQRTSSRIEPELLLVWSAAWTAPAATSVANIGGLTGKKQKIITRWYDDPSFFL